MAGRRSRALSIEAEAVKTEEEHESISQTPGEAAASAPATSTPCGPLLLCGATGAASCTRVRADASHKPSFCAPLAHLAVGFYSAPATLLAPSFSPPAVARICE
jgi:hypothetical protein